MTTRATSGPASLSMSNGGSVQDRKAAEIWRQGLLGKDSRNKQGRGEVQGGKAEPEVVFAQVHEDASVELTALTLCPEPAVAFCISSGGCTAFSLLTARPEKLVALDINPAQTYLLELKRAAFARLPYSQMLVAMQRDARPVYGELRQAISPQASAFWDKRATLLALGLCRCGLIERKSALVMRLFRLLVHNGKTIRAMLSQPSLRAQQRFYRAHWDTWRWRLGLRLALSKPALRQAYGPDFVAAVPKDFSVVMHERMARVFTQFPIRENASLWQTFLGVYPPSQQGLPPYLQRKHFEEIRARLPEACLVTGDASDWLAGQPARSIGFFALSNILEVTSPAYAQQLWRAIEHAAKPGAIVCLRSIFPLGSDQLPPEAASHIDVELSSELQSRDNSPFAACIYALRV